MRGERTIWKLQSFKNVPAQYIKSVFVSVSSLVVTFLFGMDEMDGWTDERRGLGLFKIYII